MTRRQKRTAIRIIAVFIVFIALIICEHLGTFSGLPKYAVLAVFLIPYLVIGFDVIRSAAVNISHGHVFDENFLMMIATFGAFAIGEYSEALAVMLFYQTGELFQSYAVGRSRNSIADLMSIAPESVFVENGDGTVSECEPEDVPTGSCIVVRPGERIPLDGEVISGESFIDTAALTGESVPRRAAAGDEVISGCLNGDGVLRIRTTSTYDNSTVARILELVENASNKKSRMENFITRFARYYTPVVTIGALLLAFIPPILGMMSLSDSVHRACIFLIVSCPCALVISVPMGFFGGIGAGSRIGVLVKGSNFLEAMADTRTIVFDKTGTLTKGQFKVVNVIPSRDGVCDRDELLELAAYAESFSTHPIAGSVKEAYGKEIKPDRLSDTEEIAGRGVSTLLDGVDLLVGNELLLKDKGVSFEKCTQQGTVIYISYNHRFTGCIVISDMIKDDAKEALESIRGCGINRMVMLTGDREEAANAVARSLGIDEVIPGLLPAGKVQAVEKIIEETHNRGKVAFVGDGINDAPVLMRADVGIAMGTMGSDAAIEAADIVLMNDDVAAIPGIVRIARKTIRIVKENIVFALAVKCLILISGALGFATMWMAVFGDVGVAVLAILNSMRALKIDKE